MFIDFLRACNFYIIHSYHYSNDKIKRARLLSMCIMLSKKLIDTYLEIVNRVTWDFSSKMYLLVSNLLFTSRMHLKSVKCNPKQQC